MPAADKRNIPNQVNAGQFAVEVAEIEKITYTQPTLEVIFASETQCISLTLAGTLPTQYLLGTHRNQCVVRRIAKPKRIPKYIKLQIILLILEETSAVRSEIYSRDRQAFGVDVNRLEVMKRNKLQHPRYAHAYPHSPNSQCGRRSCSKVQQNRL